MSATSGSSALNEAMLFQVENDDLVPQAEDDDTEHRNYLIFITDDLKLGLDAEYVVEILNNYAVTYLPMMPDYIRGIYNMRGQIIPIIDIRLRLGKYPKDGDSLCVVVNYNGTQIGILVDAVDQMINIANDIIMPIPSRNAQKLVSRMCTLPDGSGTMLLLDCDQLMPHE